MYPENNEYKYYSSLSFYHNGEYENALRVLSSIEDSKYEDKIATLTSYIYFEMEDT